MDIRTIKFDDDRHQTTMTEDTIVQWVHHNLMVYQGNQVHHTRNRTAIVGSAPSLAKHLDTLRQEREICALNGAGTFLMKNAIVPTALVIIDPLPDNVKFLDEITPQTRVFLASQVHPDVYEAAKLKELQVYQFHCAGIPAVADMVSEMHGADTEMIAGGITVASRAINLAVHMGFRELALYGLDSSNNDVMKHVLDQSDIWGKYKNLQRTLEVTFDGKIYHGSPAMIRQARDLVYEQIPMLEQQGIKFQAYGDGLFYDMFYHTETLEEREQRKYTTIWNNPEYRVKSPAENSVDDIVQNLQLSEYPGRGEADVPSLIDYGCGTGRATQLFSEMGYKVLGVDIAVNALDRDVCVPFALQNLWELALGIKAQYGVCCDVMEHIPPEKVYDVLRGIKAHTADGGKVYFRIDTEQDLFGATIGEPLHLTVKDGDWWYNQIENAGFDVATYRVQGRTVTIVAEVK